MGEGGEEPVHVLLGGGQAVGHLLRLLDESHLAAVGETNTC